MDGLPVLERLGDIFVPSRFVLTAHLAHDPSSGRWGYSSELTIPGGRHSLLTGWKGIGWQHAGPMVRRTVLEDVRLIERWASA